MLRVQVVADVLEVKCPLFFRPVAYRVRRSSAISNAQSTYRRVVAKVEWHCDELYPRVGFIVTQYLEISVSMLSISTTVAARLSNGLRRGRTR